MTDKTWSKKKKRENRVTGELDAVLPAGEKGHIFGQQSPKEIAYEPFILWQHATDGQLMHKSCLEFTVLLQIYDLMAKCTGFSLGLIFKGGWLAFGPDLLYITVFMKGHHWNSLKFVSFRWFTTVSLISDTKVKFAQKSNLPIDLFAKVYWFQ